MAMATDPGTRTVLRRAALFAGRAPSIHNSQPWRWRVTDQALDLFLAHSRVLRSTDPRARLALLSCGAALHHARVYLAASGCLAVVRRLPVRADPDHLAQVTVDRRIPVDPGVSVLPLNAVIEVATGCPPIRRLIGGSGYPYLVLRFAAVDTTQKRPPSTSRLPGTMTVEGLDQADP
jgi:hypothetical protein